MESTFDGQGSLTDPIKPKYTLAQIRARKPALAEALRACLFSAARTLEKYSQTVLGRSDGLEDTVEWARDAYDAGVLHVLYTTDFQFVAVFIWNESSKGYMPICSPSGCPVLLSGQGSDAVLQNRPNKSKGEDDEAP